MLEHVPVLADEVVDHLPRTTGWLLDATVGGGGHAARILRAQPAEARLLGLDRDPAALDVARGRLKEYGDRVRLVHAAFDQLGEVLRSERLGSLAGALFDLGLSSLQLGDETRGFSFEHDAALDLRFDTTRGIPTGELIRRADENEVARWLASYGELPEARRVARVLVAEARKDALATTRDVKRAVSAVWGSSPHPRRLAQLFQALRIATNDELAIVERGLAAAAGLLEPGGTLLVITYHSLEDRLVKRFLHGELPPKREAQLGLVRERLLEPAPRRAIRPSPAEVARNPRARSARLRVARRVAA